MQIAIYIKSMCRSVNLMHLSVNIHRSLALSSSVNSFSTKRSCDEVGAHLNNRQVQVCKRYIDVMNSVKFGASIAVEECQHQFRYRRWNCTTVQFEKSPVFGNSANGGEGKLKSLFACFRSRNSIFRIFFSNSL